MKFIPVYSKNDNRQKTFFNRLNEIALCTKNKPLLLLWHVVTYKSELTWRINMNKKVLICLDLIKYPNWGVGRVSIDYSKEISKTKAFDYTFLIPPKTNTEHLNNQQLVSLNLLRKFSSNYMKKYDVYHVLHQLPKF